MANIDASQVEPFREMLSAEEFNRVVELSRTPPPVAVRLNPLKVDPLEAIQSLSHRCTWEVERVPFCPSGWLLKRYKIPPGDALEYRNGHYYIQDASSMLPVEAFSFVDGHADLILDMAAAPGGKTTHLAARAGDAGLIVANDASSRRIRALSSNLRTWGVTSAVITNLQGEELGSQLPGIFDKVLLDAPCSGESLRAGGGSKGRRVSKREREALQSQQIRMLLSGMDALRVGGELVYSTCTAAPAENEAVIDAGLQRKKGQFKLTSIELIERLAVKPGGLTRFEGHEYHPSLSSTVRLWPFHFDTGAFFTARLRRTEGMIEQRADALGGKTPTLIDNNALNAIHDQLAEFGFDLLGECQRSKLVLFKQDRFIQAVSSLWLDNVPDLPVKEAGLPVGRWQGERFLPAHEWVTRYASDFRERIFTLDEDKTQRWLRGSDLRDWKPPVKGGAILLEDESGRFLGVGSISSQRVRNLLPRSWVAG